MTFKRFATFEGRADKASLTVPVVLSTEYPVERPLYDEVLSHAPGDVDLSRANPLPLIQAHDMSGLPIGVIESVHLDGRKLRGVARFSERAKDLFNDVVAGILRGISVGYRLLDDGTPVGERKRRFRWAVHEASIVAVGADPHAGFNRGHSMDLARNHAEALISAKLREVAGLSALANLTPQGDTQNLEGLYEAACSGRTSRHSLEYRDLTSAVGGAGGFLTSSQTLDPENPLPPESVARQAGVRAIVLPVPSGAPIFPVWDTRPNFEWLLTEATPLSNQTPALRAVASALKHGGALVTVSYQLNRQSNAVENLRSLVRQVAAVGADLGFFNGSGASGAPLGLLNTPGLANVSGTTWGWTAATDMEEAVALKDAADARLAYVAHPGVRKLARRREKITGGGVPVWDGNQVAGHPAFVTTSMPSASIVCGDFSNSTIVLWGGVEVLVNPYSTTGFKQGSVELAVFVAMDVIINFPSAYAKSTQIT